MDTLRESVSTEVAAAKLYRQDTLISRLGFREEGEDTAKSSSPE